MTLRIEKCIIRVVKELVIIPVALFEGTNIQTRDDITFRQISVPMTFKLVVCVELNDLFYFPFCSNK